MVIIKLYLLRMVKGKGNYETQRPIGASNTVTHNIPYFSFIFQCRDEMEMKHVGVLGRQLKGPHDRIALCWHAASLMVVRTGTCC